MSRYLSASSKKKEIRKERLNRPNIKNLLSIITGGCTAQAERMNVRYVKKEETNGTIAPIVILKIVPFLAESA